MEELKTVHEVSELTGVSIRTLHYYDEIGLLTPVTVTGSGYRLYDDACLQRLQTIMLFRELEFSLKDIRQMINSPDFDRVRALGDQIKLLELRRDQLDRLIDLARRLKLKGETDLSFKEFDKSKIEAYRKLAKETWGDTDAYREYEKKEAEQTDVEKRGNAEAMMDIFFEFGNMKEKDPAAPQVQAQVKKLQDFITKNYYTCTDNILAGLGRMYAAGGEMTDNINVAGGKGCAEFVSKAIEEYCK